MFKVTDDKIRSAVYSSDQTHIIALPVDGNSELVFYKLG